MAPLSQRFRLRTSISTTLMTPPTLQLVVVRWFSRSSPSRASYMLMGYQLLRVAAPVITLPVPLSVTSSAGTAGTPFLAATAASATPLALRSDCSWKIRIALGWTAFGAPDVGGVKPRANPSSSHSLVTGTKLPSDLWISTRRYPSSRFHVLPLMSGAPEG